MYLNLPQIEPRFPDRLAVAVPLGLRARLHQAAEAERTTLADFVRRAIEDKLSGTAQADPAAVRFGRGGS